jgi:hypothetical protein
MSLQNVSNHKQLLIGTANPSYPTAGTIATPDNLAAGVVAITTEDGVVLDASTAAAVATANRPIVVVQSQGSGKPLIKSASFSKSQLLVAKGKLYSGAAQQVSYVGYVSATTGTGTIELPGVGTPVILRNTFKTNFFQFSDKLMESIVGYKITASDTTSSLVDYLVKYAIQDVQRYVNIPYAVERVNSSTTEAAGTGTGTNIIFTKNSSQVTWTGTITNLPVGTYFRLATGVTSAIYKVKEKNATSLVLDTPYQGSTNTVAAVATLQVVTPVTTSGTAGAGWGIRFTGYPQTKFAPNIFRYETSKFVTTATNFGATTVSNAYVVPTEGSGVYEQIAEQEFFFQLFEGMHDANLIQVPPVTMRSNVELTGTYSIIDLEVATQSGTMSFINNPIARKQVRIAINRQTRVNQLDTVADILEAALGLTNGTLL